MRVDQYFRRGKVLNDNTPSHMVKIFDPARTRGKRKTQPMKLKIMKKVMIKITMIALKHSRNMAKMKNTTFLLLKKE